VSHDIVSHVTNLLHAMYIGAPLVLTLGEISRYWGSNVCESWSWYFLVTWRHQSHV